MNAEEQTIIDQVVKDLTPDPAKEIHDKIQAALNNLIVGQPNVPEVQVRAQSLVQQILQQHDIPNSVRVHAVADRSTIHLSVEFESKSPLRVLDLGYFDGHFDR